jgi:hypothetical protein
VPGFFLTDKITLNCTAGGTFTVTSPTTAVLSVAGDAVLTAADIVPGKVAVSGCGHNPVCTGMTWSNSASAVSQNGAPILLQGVSADGFSDGLCVPPSNGKLAIASGLQTFAEGV